VNLDLLNRLVQITADREASVMTTEEVFLSSKMLKEYMALVVIII